MKCDRCWSKEAVEAYAGKGLISPREVNLCGKCRAAAPTHSLLFTRLFLRFASRKEMLHHYGTRDAREAARRWCEEEGVEPEEAARSLTREDGGLDLLRPSDFAQSSHEGLPYGYIRRRGRWARATKEGEAVIEIFHRYADGESLAAIAERLERRGVPTRRGGTWHRSTVRYILRNPVYAGFRRSKGQPWRGSHPPLVDEDIFADVQRRLTERSRRPDQKASQTPLHA